MSSTGLGDDKTPRFRKRPLIELVFILKDRSVLVYRTVEEGKRMKSKDL